MNADLYLVFVSMQFEEDIYPVFAKTEQQNVNIKIVTLFTLGHFNLLTGLLVQLYYTGIISVVLSCVGTMDFIVHVYV